MNNRKRSAIVAVLIISSLAAWQSGAYAAGATLAGKVSFEGTAPNPKAVNFGAEKQCATLHGDHPPMIEDIVVNPNGTVRWAFVYVKEGAKPAPAPASAAVVDQKGCVFVPHVAAVQAGQKVEFHNNDPVLHNVRSVTKVNKAFNIAQPIQGMKSAKTFEKPEIGIQLRCDVHFWMSSYIHVLDHPYYAVTGEDGTFAIADLPDGDYTVELWHEKLGTQTQKVTVKDGQAPELVFTLKTA